MLKLSSQNLAEVVEALRVNETLQGGAENRRAARLDVHANVVVAPLRDGRPGRATTALTRDISFMGIGILCTTSFAPKQQLVVRLPRGKKPPLFVSAVVTQVRTLADGLYLVGAQYTAPVEMREEDLLGRSAGDEITRVRQAIMG